jgi:hypothetical protein
VNIPVTLTLENLSTQPQLVRIPRGYVVEHRIPSERVQNVAVAEEMVVTLAPGERRRVTINGRCLNQSRPAPTGQPGRGTMFRYAGPTMNQAAIWQRLRSPTYR